MRKILIFLFLVLIGAESASGCWKNWEIKRDKIVSSALKGNKLNDPETRDLVIFLPPGYKNLPRQNLDSSLTLGNKTSKKYYPTIYFLHGFEENQETYLKILGEKNVINFLGWLSFLGDLKETIIVIPDASNKYKGSWYTNSDVGDYEDYLKEVIEFIDKNYRTIPREECRSIFGFSMGGYGALMLSMKTELFSKVAALSAPLDFQVIRETIALRVIGENPGKIKEPQGADTFTRIIYAMSTVFSSNETPPYFCDFYFEYPTGEIKKDVWDKWEEKNPANLIEKYKSRLNKLKIYIDNAVNDELGLFPAVESFHQKLLELGIVHQYKVFKSPHGREGENISQQVLKRFVEAIKFLSKE